ncbi:MAG: aminotransferase class I/II-fold pyridoxal phosphate-dependent enzyme [Alphaproteobacteria bacterium]|nr:aminotransferase class I/II-fold pyridoxal phosphate-dependent enzyme [Alphaproteobacteria bacterium]
MSQERTQTGSKALGVVPLQVPDLRGRERELLAQCVDDNWVSSAGPFVSEFETRVAEVSERAFAVATSSGTAALHMGLVALGVRPGDRVILPDWTFAASANAVCHAGATPVFVDISPETWCVDPEAVRAVLTEKSAVATFVMGVHALGLPADVDTLESVVRESGSKLLIDAAGAIGSMYHQRAAAKFGDAACYSFNGNKLVTSGGGGMLVTDDESLADRARLLTVQARTGDDYSHSAVGWNYRMTNLSAAVGLAQLERLDEMVESKRAIGERYDSAFLDRDDVLPMPRIAGAFHNHWLYSVRLANESAAQSLVEHLTGHGVQARIFWRSLSTQAAYKNFESRAVRVSQKLSGTVVSLPSSSGLSVLQQGRVLAAMRTWRGPGVAPLGSAEIDAKPSRQE